MTVIELPDDAAAALAAKAAADGLSLEAWLKRLAHSEDTSLNSEPIRPIWEVIVDSMKHVPSEDLAALPHDGASQIDHYVYGLPKREL
jgi:hypothetical protein